MLFTLVARDGCTWSFKEQQRSGRPGPGHATSRLRHGTTCAVFLSSLIFRCIDHACMHADYVWVAVRMVLPAPRGNPASAQHTWVGRPPLQAWRVDKGGKFTPSYMRSYLSDIASCRDPHAAICHGRTLHSSRPRGRSKQSGRVSAAYVLRSQNTTISTLHAAKAPFLSVLCVLGCVCCYMLTCGGQEILFASFGTPTGSCSSGFQASNCSRYDPDYTRTFQASHHCAINSAQSVAVVAKECVGKSQCTVREPLPCPILLHA